LGINMLEVYGQTENPGLATAIPPDRIKLGSVGVARPGTEVRLSPEGEILLKGPHVFKGYYGKPEKTAETIVDGWLHTGDVGTIDDEGFVRITDRMRDIIITAGGKNVTPSEIENQLKFSPYISDAVVIGDRRKYLSCLVMIDHETVAQFAQEKNVPFSNFASLCRAPEVQDLIWGEIERVNRQLARVETIKTFRLIEQLLTPEDEELTPTMKLKRTFVNVKYKDLIEGMYERSEGSSDYWQSACWPPRWRWPAWPPPRRRPAESPRPRSCSACTPTSQGPPPPTASRRRTRGRCGSTRSTRRAASTAARSA